MKLTWQDVVVHACNPSHLGSGERRIVFFMMVQEKLTKPDLKNELNMIFHNCVPSFLAIHKLVRTGFQESLGKVSARTPV
jgi:hypothetical protein